MVTDVSIRSSTVFVTRYTLDDRIVRTEPAAWTSMNAGFGVIGGGLRRRAVTAVA